MGYHTLRGFSRNQTRPLAIFVYDLNDFTLSDPFNIWKFVDDSTVSETIRNVVKSNFQLALNEVNDWSKNNFFQLNGDKNKRTDY